MNEFFKKTKQIRSTRWETEVNELYLPFSGDAPLTDCLQDLFALVELKLSTTVTIRKLTDFYIGRLPFILTLVKVYMPAKGCPYGV